MTTVEVPCHPLDIADFSPRSGVAQVWKKLVKHDFEILRFTGARGPILTATGQFSKVGDSIVLIAASKFDKPRRVGIWCWMDGTVDWVRIGTTDDAYYWGYRKVGAAEARKWIASE